LFVTLYRTAADTDVVEDAKRVTLVDETDDSCTTRPPDRVTSDYCTSDFLVSEVKQDVLQDVKTVDPRESDMEYRSLSVKVRTYTLFVFKCSRSMW